MPDSDLPQEENPHFHPSWEIGICLKGSGVFFIGSREFRYSAGDVSVIAPGVAHLEQGDPEENSVWKYLFMDLTGMLKEMPLECAELAECSFTGVLHPEENPLIAPLVLLLLDELRFSKLHSRALIRLKVAELALHLQRMNRYHDVMTVLPDALSEISPAVLHIVNHYSESITLQQLAAMCSMSATSFRREFSRAMHMSPFEYLYTVRIKAAVNLLHTTNLPVSDIASRVGYQSLSSFNRHFRRIAGMSPLNCRKYREVDMEEKDSDRLHILQDYPIYDVSF